MAGAAGRSGRRPKPTAKKLLAGNPGKRALNKTEPDFELVLNIDCPDWMGDNGRMLWETVAPQLCKERILAATDIQNLEVYCSAYDQFRMTGASRIWPWLALALALLLAVQTQRLAKVETSHAKAAVTHAQQAQAATEKKAEAVVKHGAVQQENTHDYTQEMARLEAGRTADAARIAGLQRDISSAATRNAQLASDSAACRGLADQHQRLAAIAAEGAGLVGELGDLVQKRDAQVSLLRGQIKADRKLLEKLN